MEVIHLNNYTYAYPGTDRSVLAGIDLTIETGQCHCVTGRTGGGKTTLGLAVKGLLPPGGQSGEIIYAHSDRPEGSQVGVVLQNPETQLLAFTVGAEAAFGLESLGEAPASMPEKVERVLSRLGLDKPLDFDTHKLSMGEKYRLILASHLVMGRTLLVLDEPAGQLDPRGLERLLEIIKDLKRAGMAFLLLENRTGPLNEAVDFFWRLTDQGHLRPGRQCAPSVESARPAPACVSAIENQFSGSPPGAAEQVVSVRGLTLNDQSGRSVLSDLSMSVSRGRRVVVYGENGAGKTTLLRCLMGFVKPSKGEIGIFGAKPEPAKLRGKVGCMFQNPEKQLFEGTVYDEVAFPLRRLGKKEKELDPKVMEVLALFGLEGLAQFSPHKLSYGQKHLVALASSLAPGVALLILDDPFAGLDRIWCETISQLLYRVNDELGATIVLTSHDPTQLQDWADHVFYIKDGRDVDR